MSKFLGNVNTLDLTYQNLCCFGNCNACECSYLICRLTDYLCVKRAVYDNCLSYLIKLILFKEIATAI